MAIKKHNFKSIAVLAGGWAPERYVSLNTGKSVYEMLLKTDYRVTLIDVQKDLQKLIDEIKAFQPDVIFNALHGEGGEDGIVQGVLTMLGIPYTHSGIMASSIAMNKLISRRLFESIGIPFAPHCAMPFKDYAENQKNHPMVFPYVIKPVSSGSSYGVSIIRSDQDKQKAILEWDFGETIIIEQYIPGREIQVAVMGQDVLGAIEIRPKKDFYDYEAKYTKGVSDYIMPAPLTEKDQQLIYDYAKKAHTILGCKGFTRSDFRLDESKTNEGRIAMLELNTHPGMSALSLVPKIAQYYGLSFLDVIEYYLNNVSQ